MDKNQISQHMTFLKNLKRWFDDFSGVDKHYEAHKIWARWIITHLSLSNQNSKFRPHPFIPAKTDDDMQIIVELIAKGTEPTRAITHCKALHNQVSIHLEKHEFNMESLYKATVQCEYDMDMVTLTVGVHSFSISIEIYEKLEKMYLSTMRSTGMILSCFKNQHIWYMYGLYHMLDGKSLQWAVPKHVFRFINSDLGCNTELFASPLNVYFKRFYSLFDIDRRFGSRGSFFEAPDSDFEEGCFQLNPPFIDILFTEISKRILRYLKIADKDDKKLTFIYIMPDWVDLEGYDLLAESQYCVKEITLEAGKHFYYQTEKYPPAIRVHFRTKIMFMSTDVEACSYRTQRKLISLFGDRYSNSSLDAGAI